MENNSIKLNSSKFHQSLVECAFINNNSYRAFPTPTFIPINSKGPFLFCSQISSTPIFRQRYVKKERTSFPKNRLFEKLLTIVQVQSILTSKSQHRGIQRNCQLSYIILQIIRKVDEIEKQRHQCEMFKTSFITKEQNFTRVSIIYR